MADYASRCSGLRKDFIRGKKYLAASVGLERPINAEPITFSSFTKVLTEFIAMSRSQIIQRNDRRRLDRRLITERLPEKLETMTKKE
jgi:hypothetical protein